MKILEKIRLNIFWTIDFLKGSPIKKHLKDITEILDNYSTSESELKRELYLKKLIKHVVKTSEFYKLYSPVSPLSNFPVIDKNTLRDEKEKIYSNAKLNGKKFSSVTSGSTGTPLEIIHDKNKKLRNTADVIYFSRRAHYKLGYKLFFLRRWSSDLKKSFFLSKIQNIAPIDVLNLDGESITHFIDKMKKDSSTKGWIGYASGYDEICKYLNTVNAKPIEANIKSIIAISEGLSDYTKKGLSYYFNAPVFSRYSNMENGILAQQTPNSKNDFTINWASYYVEVLDMEKDIPAKAGTPGRIVVTDLFSYYMPLIRYNTGDIGILDNSVFPPVFKRVEGRSRDIIYNTKGLVTPSMIIDSVDLYGGILQGQLIQEEKKQYTLKLNVTDKFDKENEIINEFKEYLGDDALISIEYVQGIPRLNSGKRRATVNNYIK